MPKLRDEDLFKNSTMTFGEHLDELRRCLFKALMGLAVGVVVGLYFGGDVVEFIQRPLHNALVEYREKRAVENAKKEIAAETTDKDPKLDPARQLADLIEKHHMLMEEVRVLPSELIAALERLSPEAAAQFQKHLAQNKAAAKANPGAEGIDPDDLIQLHLLRPTKDDDRVKIKSLSAQEPFSIYMKASLLVGAIVASPWVFYQLWVFVGAGLYPHEKHYVHIFFPFSLGLFLAGAALAFFVVFKPVLSFLFSFNAWMNIDPDPRISEWLSFVLILPLGFGIGFQLPLVMLFLERIGVFSVKIYMSHWRISVLAISVIAMILTPPDPYSMMLMFGPLTLLYFGGILLCKLLPRRANPLFGRWDEEEESG